MLDETLAWASWIGAPCGSPPGDATSAARQRVLLTVSSILRAQAATGADAFFGAEVERLLERRVELKNELATFTGACERDGVRFCVLRGFGAERLWRLTSGDQLRTRQFNDLDVVVARGQFHHAIQAALSCGWYLSRPVVARRDGWAGAALRKRYRPAVEPLYLDIVSGGPGISASTHFGLTESDWDAAQRSRSIDGFEPTLTPETALVCFAIELEERADPTTRDLLDLEALLSAIDERSLIGASEKMRMLNVGEVLGLAAHFLTLRGVPKAQVLENLRNPGTKKVGLRRRAHEMLEKWERSSPGARAELWIRFPAGLLWQTGLPVYAVPTLGHCRPRCRAVARGPLASWHVRVRPVMTGEEWDATFGREGEQDFGREPSSVEGVQ